MTSSPIALVAALALGLSVATTGVASADGSFWSWFAGDWSLTLGGAGLVAPDYEGSDSYALSAAPIISLGRRGSLTRFSSRNDSASFAIMDTGSFRIGPAAKLLLPRSD